MKKVEKQNIPILSPRYGISCSHHPRRLSRTSFYRRLISLFSPRTPSAFSGVPRWTHSVGAGVPDGPLLFFSPTLPAKGIPRPERGSLLAAAPKVTKNAALNRRFQDFLRGWPRHKTPPCTPRRPKYMPIVVQRIACTPLIAAAPAYRAETRRSVIVQRDCCVHIGGFPNTGAPR